MLATFILERLNLRIFVFWEDSLFAYFFYKLKFVSVTIQVNSLIFPCSSESIHVLFQRGST